MRLALTTHPSVEGAIANQKAVFHEQQQEFSRYLPDLNIRAATGRIFANNSTSRGSSVTRSSTYSYLGEGGVTLTQPLFDGFETTNRVNAASSRYESASFSILDVRENLALRTTLAYLGVMRSQSILDEIDGYYERLGVYVDRIEALVNEGAVDSSLLVRAKDIRAEVNNTKANIRSALRNAEAEFAELVGRNPGPGLRMPFPDLNFISSDIEDAVSYAKANHPIVRAAEMRQLALADDAEAAKQFYYPDLDGELSYFERDQNEDIGGELVDARALVRLTWDLSVGGRDKADYKRAKQRHLEAKARWRDQQRQIERQLRVAYSDMIRGQEQLDIQNRRLAIAEDLFETYQNQFQGARIDVFQLIQADNDLFGTSLATINSKYALLGSQYSVLASMGRLQESLFGETVAYSGDF